MSLSTVSCSSRTSKPKATEKWTNEEVHSLTKIVDEERPKSSADWTKVCLKMHAQDSRRRQCDYKAKYLSTQALLRSDTFTQNQKIEIDKTIVSLFQQGKSPKEISHLLSNTLVKTIEKILNSLFHLLHQIMMANGLHGVRKLTVKDHHLFGFIKEHQLAIEQLAIVERCCITLKLQKIKRCQLKMQNPENFAILNREMKRIVTLFNQNMITYSEQHEAHLNRHNLTSQEAIFKKKVGKRDATKSSTVPFMYLKEVSEFPNMYRNLPALFSPENLLLRDQSLEQSLNVCFRTSSSLTEPDDYTQNTLLQLESEDSNNRGPSPSSLFADLFSKPNPNRLKSLNFSDFE